jgi:DNA-binding transcriptional ArsR family regulator
VVAGRWAFEFNSSIIPNYGKFEIQRLPFYINAMTRFVHPNLKDVPLPSVLHALSDPTRLAIVRALDENRAAKGEGLACGCAAPSGPKATISNHFSILRSAGLIESRKEGTNVLNCLRRKDVDARFPGLLDAVLRADPT